MCGALRGVRLVRGARRGKPGGRGREPFEAQGKQAPALHTSCPFARGESRRRSQAFTPGTMYRAPTEKGQPPRQNAQVRGARRGRRTSRSSLIWSIPVASRRRLISEPKVRKMQSRTHSVVRMGVEVAPDFSRNGVSSSACLRTDTISAEGPGDLSAGLPFFDMRSLCHTRLPPSSRLVWYDSIQECHL